MRPAMRTSLLTLIPSTSVTCAVTVCVCAHGAARSRLILVEQRQDRHQHDAGEEARDRGADAGATTDGVHGNPAGGAQPLKVGWVEAPVSGGCSS